MNDIIIMVDKNAIAYKKCSFQKIGNEQQNLQNKLKFEFEDEIVEGQAWLEYEIDGQKKYTPMEKYEKGYQIDIKNSLLTSDKVLVDLKITQDEEPEGVPVFITNIITFDVEKTICAEEEEPDDYPSWFETANKIINEANNLNLDINKNDKVSTITINKKDGTQKSVDVYDGTDGKNGEDATINGHNTLIITTDNNVTLAQQENIMKLGLNSQLIPKNKVEGTENIFEDSLDMPLFEFSGDGKSEQVTTEGYNELEPKMETSTRLGVTCTNNRDGTFTLNGTATSEADFRINQSVALGTDNLMNINGEYTLKCDELIEGVRLSVVQNETFSFKLSINSNEKSKNFNFENVENCFIVVFVNSGTTLNNLKIKPLFYKGTEDKEYEPYTGGQSSPNPDYEQSINSIEGEIEFVNHGSKNLFDYNYFYNNYVPPENGNIGRLLYTLKSNTKYTISTNKQSINGPNVACIFAWKGSEIQKGNISTDYQGVLPSSPRTITTDENGNLVFGIYISGDFKVEESEFESGETWIQIEEGSHATIYDPYVEVKEVEFNLGEGQLRSVENIKDEFLVDLENGDYYKKENVGEFIFNGLNDSNIFDIKLVSSTIGDDLIAGVFSINNTIKEPTNNPISNKLSTKILGDSNDRENTNNVRFYEGIAHNNANNNQFIISIKKDRLISADLEGFKQYFSDNPIKIQCALEKQNLIKVGTLSSEDLSKLRTFNGYNYIIINTNLGLVNIRLTYGLDIKKYVDNKLKIATQI